jgi:hypothetical protein
MRTLAPLLLLALLARQVLSTEIQVDDSAPKDIIDELYDLVRDMDDLTDKLRDDQTNDSVSVFGKQIEDKLDGLIKEIENAKPSIRRPARSDQALKAAGREPKKISCLSPLTPGKVTPHRIVLQEFTDSQWYKLPDARRGEMIQTWASELPVRWKCRIEAYFVSVAANESDAEIRNANLEIRNKSEIQMIEALVSREGN